MSFILQSEFTPSGDQPEAIKALAAGLLKGYAKQTLLGATGTGKTFTVANIIALHQKPTLVIAHNKTLAAQLAEEYRAFFPQNAVHYFVSYYDFYQPEAYMPITDTYIEKEAMINEEIERLRHASTQALLTRCDTIIVASVSCIYGLGSPASYEAVNLKLARSMETDRAALIRKLTSIYFTRTNADLTPGLFRAQGNMLEIMPTNERVIYRLSFSGGTKGTLTRIEELDPISRVIRGEREILFIFPAKHYVTPEHERARAIADIRAELKVQLKQFEKEGKPLEAERIKRRTTHDLALIKEVGYCNGIENYSRHFDGRKEGEPPYTLLDYFPHQKDGKPDFLTIIDESHVTVPQIGGMYAGDRSRKDTLVAHGFRLPSAVDNRPLTFAEFEARVGQTIYTSATPGTYEREHSLQIVEQLIRPTGLVDPELVVRPVSASATYGGEVEDFLDETERAVKKGGRVLITTLTKKMAEDLAEFLRERGVAAEYLHSDIKTIERIELLTRFRKGPSEGGFDVLVGVNLLREGLDLPEVTLIGILDADKEGFLRSETSLIQTIGRAARNVEGRVILYADTETGSLARAIAETDRRRALQVAYNKKHGITPRTVSKKIHDITAEMRSEHERAVHTELELDMAAFRGNKKQLIREKTKQMNAAVKRLDFETAAILRDEIKMVEQKEKSKLEGERNGTI